MLRQNLLAHKITVGVTIFFICLVNLTFCSKSEDELVCIKFCKDDVRCCGVTCCSPEAYTIYLENLVAESQTTEPSSSISFPDINIPEVDWRIVLIVAVVVILPIVLCVIDICYGCFCVIKETEEYTQSESFSEEDSHVCTETSTVENEFTIPKSKEVDSLQQMTLEQFAELIHTLPNPKQASAPNRKLYDIRECSTLDPHNKRSNAKEDRDQLEDDTYVQNLRNHYRMLQSTIPRSSRYQDPRVTASMLDIAEISRGNLRQNEACHVPSYLPKDTENRPQCSLGNASVSHCGTFRRPLPNPLVSKLPIMETKSSSVNSDNDVEKLASCSKVAVHIECDA